MENKTSKYLKYAIGEIVLVVIGILIALQINNWNEQQHLDTRRNIILSELRNDFIYNKNHLEETYQGHRKVLEICKKIIDKMPLSEANNLDSIAYYLQEGNIFSWFTYNPRNGTVNSLINTSSFEIIDNNELRSLLVGWEDVLSDYSEDEVMANNFLFHYLNPFTFKHFQYDMELSDPRTEVSALNGLEFENLLKERYNSIYYLVEGGDRNDYVRLKESIDKILELTKPKE